MSGHETRHFEHGCSAGILAERFDEVLTGLIERWDVVRTTSAKKTVVRAGRFPMIVDRPDAPGSTQDTATWVGALISVRASTIYADTNQRRRDLLVERVLDVPVTHTQTMARGMLS